MTHFSPADATPWRACDVGKTFWLAYSSPKSFGGRYFCPKHMRELFADFDPQPRPKEVEYGQKQGDHTVRMIEGGHPTADTQYVVLERQGTMLKLRQVGFPDWTPTWMPVGALWPVRYPNYTPGCKK